MNIVLKNLKTFKRMTQETPCFTAALYVDGQCIGTLSNDGHGGANKFTGPWAWIDKLDAYLAAHNAPIEIEGMSLAFNLEMWAFDQAYTKMGM